MKFIKFYILLLLSYCMVASHAYAQFDTDFGASGKAIITGSYVSESFQTGLQSTGKLIVVGQNMTPVTFVKTIKIVRLNSNGSLDASFGTGGELIIDLPGVSEVATRVQVLSDDKIIVSGSYVDVSNNYPFVLKLNSDGSFDTNFDTDGYTTITGVSSPMDMAIQSDGKIVVLTTLSLFRLNTDGSLDTNFDADGKFEFNVSYFLPEGLAIQSNGKFLVSGGDFNNSVILRIEANGGFDATFGNSGVVMLDISWNPDVANSISVLEDGNIIVAGNTFNQAYLAKLSVTDGTLDHSFSADGIEKFAYPGAKHSIISSVKEDTVNNDIIVGGTALYIEKGYFAVARFSSTGTNEALFVLPIGTTNSEIRNIYIQPDRKIVLTGHSYDVSKQMNFTIARFIPDATTVVSSITSTEITVGINLFPNPANHTIHINSSYVIQNIMVFDVLGNELLNQETNGNTQLDISTLLNGLYNFVISTDRGIATEKISIQ